MTDASSRPSGRFSRLRSWGRRLRDWTVRFGRRLVPSPEVRRGAAWGGWLLLALAAAGYGSTMQFGLPWKLDPLAGAALALAVVTLFGWGLALAVHLLAGLRRWLGSGLVAALAGSVLLLVFFSRGLGMPVGIAAAVALFAAGATLGGMWVALRRREPSSWRQWVRRGAVILALAFLATAAGWLFFQRGSTEHLVKVKQGSAPAVAWLALPDPGARGPYAVSTLTYGSGTDRRRPEFGAKVTIRTPTVDGTAFVTGNEGWRIGARDWFWGFGFKKWPLNARVWVPQGKGPFPVALIVHGNHNMADYSDPGYAYLGELMASRGFLFASVDENFVNGSIYGGLERENDARGWLLLKHLEQWRRFNGDPENPLYGKVDLDRIGLLGHSRGGEAVAVAGFFNRLARYPDDANVKFNFDFTIRGLVAIAPIDGQYKPAGRPTPLRDVDYLLLHGGHDADVSTFSGDRIFRRLRFTDDPRSGYRFKASLVSYRSNHGQFNSVWGNADSGWPTSLLLNRKTLLPADEQRRLGGAAISAFLEASLNGRREYVAFLRDPRRGAAWLPDDLSISRFQDSNFRAVANYDEEDDLDVTAGTLTGARLSGTNLAVWREEDLAFRKEGGTKQNQVVRLGFRADPKKIARYTVDLPEGGVAALGLTSASLLSFTAADTGKEPPEPKAKDGDKKKEDGKKDEKAEKAKKAEKEKKDKEKKAREEREKKEGKTPLDFTIELVDAAGHVARLPVSRFRALPVPWKVRVTRVPDEKEQYGEPWEITLQTFELPLAAFAAAAPGFDPATVASIRFVFEGPREGVIVLDDIGFGLS